MAGGAIVRCASYGRGEARCMEERPIQKGLLEWQLADDHLLGLGHVLHARAIEIGFLGLVYSNPEQRPDGMTENSVLRSTPRSNNSNQGGAKLRSPTKTLDRSSNWTTTQQIIPFLIARKRNPEQRKDYGPSEPTRRRPEKARRNPAGFWNASPAIRNMSRRATRLLLVFENREGQRDSRFARA